MGIMALLWELPTKLIAMINIIWAFLFTTISIVGYDVSMWGLVGGTGLVGLIIWGIIRGGVL